MTRKGDTYIKQFSTLCGLAYFELNFVAIKYSLRQSRKTYNTKITDALAPIIRRSQFSHVMFQQLYLFLNVLDFIATECFTRTFSI